jgi:hypothetical protein
MEPGADFPRAPNAFALPKASVENGMRAQVALDEGAFFGRGIVMPFEDELSDAIAPCAAEGTIRKLQGYVHAMLVRRLIIVEPGPFS